jgi:hypothetical protein
VPHDCILGGVENGAIGCPHPPDISKIGFLDYERDISDVLRKRLGHAVSQETHFEGEFLAHYDGAGGVGFSRKTSRRGNVIRKTVGSIRHGIAVILCDTQGGTQQRKASEEEGKTFHGSYGIDVHYKDTNERK